MPISFDSVTRLGEEPREDRFICRASDLGLIPGICPPTLEIDIGNGSALELDRIVSHEDTGAFGALYRQENSLVEVLVLLA